MKKKGASNTWRCGFVRYDRFELNWDIGDWALLFEICNYEHLFYVRFLYLGIFIEKSSK